jgi:type II restriction enzyme
MTQTKTNNITGNVGEWSEIYTLLKLLGEGKVYAGDQNLDKIKNLFYPIIMILRHENDGNFNYKVSNPDVVIVNETGTELLRVPSSVFVEEAENLLTVLQDHQKGKGAFAVPATQKFMDKIFCHTLKAKSQDKTDIRIVLHDQRTKINTEMGFSIKSQLGARSTLLNPGKTTNFKYKVAGKNLSDEIISKINGIATQSKILDRVNAIYNAGAVLTFDKVVNDTFSQNLMMLDGGLSTVMAEALLISNRYGFRDYTDILDKLTESNPLAVPNVSGEQSGLSNLYRYKLKHLLTAVALGMTPGSLWNGYYDANGGYLVVKKDGEILCYHFYDRNRFEDFLFSNASLDNPSTSRYEFGSLYFDENNQLSFNLNLQIRLK